MRTVTVRRSMDESGVEQSAMAGTLPHRKPNGRPGNQLAVSGRTAKSSRETLPRAPVGSSRMHNAASWSLKAIPIRGSASGVLVSSGERNASGFQAEANGKDRRQARSVRRPPVALAQSWPSHGRLMMEGVTLRERMGSQIVEQLNRSSIHCAMAPRRGRTACVPRTRC